MEVFVSDMYALIYLYLVCIGVIKAGNFLFDSALEVVNDGFYILRRTVL
jgi:hypothetical protein